MAPVTTQVIELYIWNHFTAVLDGQPAIGSALYTYAAGTSTPKAAYQDAFLTVAHPNPILLNDQGSADIHLAGTYHLRLHDPEGVLIWDVDNFAFPSSAPAPDPGDKIMGSTATTVSAANGQGVIPVPSLVPTGYRCEGITWTITTGFGASGGLTGLLIGDGIVNDRWGRLTTVSAGQTGGQVNFRSDTTPVEPIPYVLLVASEGGLMDATGQIHLRAYWSALPADVP